MTIGWGTIGVEWGRPAFAAFVRPRRFTHELPEESGEFTVNAPTGPFDNRIPGLRGTRTGRDCDKFALAGLSARPGGGRARYRPAFPDAEVQSHLLPASGRRCHPCRHPAPLSRQAGPKFHSRNRVLAPPIAAGSRASAF